MSLISHHSLAGSVRDRVKIANTQSSGVTYTQGAVNQAAVMNSASITIPVACRSTYSLSFWLKLKSTNTGSYRKFLSCPGPGTDRSPGMWFHSVNTSLHLRQSINGANEGADTSNLVVGQWYRVTFICESLSNNTTRLSSWLNDVLQVSTVYPGYPDYNNSPIDLLAGDYDLEDIRVYDHALCKREVIDLNQKLLSRYHLAANGHDMEEVGTMSYGAGQFLETDKGRALVLGSSFANVPLSDAPLTLKGETITFWQRCKLPRASVGGGSFSNRILQWGTYYNNNSGGFGLQSGGMSYYLRGAGASGWRGAGASGWTTTGSISAGNALYDQGGWIHYAVVLTNDDRFQLYMNGDLYVDRALAAPYTGLVSQGVDFGENMDADLMDVRFYRREVPVAEIQDIYRQKLSIDGGGSIHSSEFIQKLQARYIRDWVNGSTSNGGNHWLEVRAVRDGTNVSLGSPVTASASGANLSKVTDGTTSNSGYASVTSAAPAWVQVDLGSIQEIDEIQVWHYNADGRTYFGTKTEVSNDGVNWTAVFDSEFDGTYQETAAGITHKAVPRTSKVDSRGMYAPDISEVGPAGLLAWYPLIDTPDQRAFHGDIYNLNTFIEHNGAYFNGTNGWFSIPELFPTGSVNRFTVSFLINPETGGRFLCPNSHGVDQYMTYNATDQSVALSITEAADTNGRGYASPVGSVPIGQWTLVTFSIDDRDVALYINGVYVAGAIGTGPIASWHGRWDVGRRANGTYYFGGRIKDFRVYNKALPSTQVALLPKLIGDSESVMSLSSPCLYAKRQIKEVVV